MVKQMNKGKKDFDRESSSWDDNPGRVRLADDIARAISEEVVLSPNMDVLDFGCGTGLLTLKLQPFVRSVIGVDSSQGMLDVLRAKIERNSLRNVRTRYLDIGQGEILEGSYDLIVSSMTFHHIREIGPLLEQFRKVSAPAGLLCIADLDPDDGQFHSSNEGVFHFGFDREFMRQALTDAGFGEIRDRTAAEVVKPSARGGTRLFSVFLMTGRRSPSR